MSLSAIKIEKKIFPSRRKRSTAAALDSGAAADADVAAAALYTSKTVVSENFDLDFEDVGHGEEKTRQRSVINTPCCNQLSTCNHSKRMEVKNIQI